MTTILDKELERLEHIATGLEDFRAYLTKELMDLDRERFEAFKQNDKYKMMQINEAKEDTVNLLNHIIERSTIVMPLYCSLKTAKVRANQ